MPRISYNGVPMSSDKLKNKCQELSDMQQSPRKRSKTTTTQKKVSQSINAENNEKKDEEGNILLQNIINLLESKNSKSSKPEKTTKHHKHELKKAREEASFWKNQFETLRDLRETEPENQLKEFQITVAEKEASINDLITSIKKEVKGNNENNGEIKCGDALITEESVSGEYEESLEVIDALESKLESKLAIILAYEKLTGFVMKPVYNTSEDGEKDSNEEEEEDNPSTFHCTALNHVHGRITKFSLKFPTKTESSTSVTFKPMSNRQFIPPALREKSEVEIKQLPMVAQRVLKTFYASTPPP